MYIIVLVIVLVARLTHVQLMFVIGFFIHHLVILLLILHLKNVLHLLTSCILMKSKDM